MSPANFMVGSPAGRARLFSRLANGIARERRTPAERSMRMGRREDRGKNSRASTEGGQKARRPMAVSVVLVWARAAKRPAWPHPSRTWAALGGCFFGKTVLFYQD